ncbi:MAG TPA: hypothetical protein VGG22_14860 [Candidatus Baltobacteraceae bacterium]|jgi:hypothetical protein
MKTLLRSVSLWCVVAAVAAVHATSFADEASPTPSAATSPAFSSGGQLAPVHIITCRLDYQVGGMFGLLGKNSGALTISFTNESNKQIDVARFAIDLEGKTASIRDVGKFAPGITVNHNFKDFAGNMQWVFSRQPQPTCQVTFVKFDDGTVWGETGEPLPEISPVASPSPSASP